MIDFTAVADDNPGSTTWSNPSCEPSGETKGSTSNWSVTRWSSVPSRLTTQTDRLKSGDALIGSAGLSSDPPNAIHSSVGDHFGIACQPRLSTSTRESLPSGAIVFSVV